VEVEVDVEVEVEVEAEMGSLAGGGDERRGDPKPSQVGGSSPELRDGILLSIREWRWLGKWRWRWKSGVWPER
jgi:hypothetical protein